MSATSALIARARAWAEGDPDPSTRAELEVLIEAEDHGELADRMSARPASAARWARDGTG